MSKSSSRSKGRYQRLARCVLILTIIGDLQVSLVASTGNNFFPRAPSALTRSIPALSLKRINKASSSLNEKAIEVSTKIKELPNHVGFFYGIRDDLMQRSKAIDVSTKIKKLPNHVGFFYGIRDDLMQRSKPSKKPSLSDVMMETLDELREMREEMAALRREMHRMKHGISSEDDGAVGQQEESGITGLVHRRMRQRNFDKIGMEVEQWAEKVLFQEDGEEHGWKEVQCHKMFRKKFNKDETTRCYIKWMRDTRSTNSNDNNEYPCIKCYATLDAPMEDVCAYLSDESRVPEYNDLMVKHKDLEEISPHSKITWGQCPKILFIKPRDFVTYCHHRWLRDGTQVVVNQACEHPDAPAETKETEGKACRAYALRGANFISRDPEDPNKTKFCLLAHADPGGGIPPWACKTAVNALAPIEPFKLFYKINKNVKKLPPQPERTEMVSSITGRSARAAGLSQMGYACFWPNGGGIKEGILHHGHPHQVDPTQENGEHTNMKSNDHLDSSESDSEVY